MRYPREQLWFQPERPALLIAAPDIPMSGVFLYGLPSLDQLFTSARTNRCQRSSITPGTTSGTTRVLKSTASPRPEKAIMTRASGIDLKANGNLTSPSTCRSPAQLLFRFRNQTGVDYFAGGTTHAIPPFPSSLPHTTSGVFVISAPSSRSECCASSSVHVSLGT